MLSFETAKKGCLITIHKRKFDILNYTEYFIILVKEFKYEIKNIKKWMNIINFQKIPFSLFFSV